MPLPVSFLTSKCSDRGLKILTEPRGQEIPSSRVNIEEAIKQLTEIHAQYTKEGSRKS
jgi:hypothetical protein